jgi:hypothetical protein
VAAVGVPVVVVVEAEAEGMVVSVGVVEPFLARGSLVHDATTNATTTTNDARAFVAKV